MRAGKLRHRIRIQKKTSNQNAAGEPVETWVTHVTTWANVEPLRGREYLEARSQQQSTSHRVTLRHPRKSVAPEMRVLFDGRTLQIESVINTGERNIDLVLMCQEMS